MSETTDLDLDAIEREYAEMAASEIAHYEAYGDDRILALIQRLREAQVERDDWRHVFHLARIDLEMALARLKRVEKAALELNHALNDVLDTHRIVSPKATDALLHHAVAIAVGKNP